MSSKRALADSTDRGRHTHHADSDDHRTRALEARKAVERMIETAKEDGEPVNGQTAMGNAMRFIARI